MLLKICIRCHEEKDLSSFGKHKRRKDGLLEICRACRQKERTDRQNPEYAKARYLRKREEIRARAKEHYKENKEMILARNAKYQKKWNLENLNYFVEWRSKNLAKQRFYSHKRKAAELKATPPWLSEEQKAHMQIFYDAACDLQKELKIELHVDHIIPLQGKNVCGLHVPWNLQVLTKYDNLSKGNRS